MNTIKKTGIIAGAVVGGVIGGTISIIGKMSKQKFIDELGESIVDSTILTGGIAGEIASGATHVVAGKAQGKPLKVKEGKQDLMDAGGHVVDNFLTNTKTIINQSGEILDGVKKRDGKKVVRASKTLAKIVAVGAITVGAIKVKEYDDGETDSQEMKQNEKDDQ